MQRAKHLFIITGPTAVGKTDLTVDLASLFRCDIISCDSRQFYREMNIGTAKPSESQLAQVKHHFINSLSVDQSFSAGDFERHSEQLLETLFEDQGMVIATGGSGLYIKALCEGFDSFPVVDKKIIERLKSQFKKEGIQPLQEQLSQSDPEYFKIVDQQNAHRLIRALSIIQASGNPYSSYLNKAKAKKKFKVTYIILERDRDELYKRINLRVDLMIKEGLVEEAKLLYPKKALNALQTVGYQELFDHFDEKITLQNAVDLIKRNSRRYAKRQMTWFRRIDNAHYFHPAQAKEIRTLIQKSMDELK